MLAAWKTHQEVVMAALVVVSVSPGHGPSTDEGRIQIFPGGSTPSMYPANTRFWVGYGFAADHESGDGLDDETTRFELDVDGTRASMLTERQGGADHPARTTHIADFPNGLPAGWHDLAGRWYDDGRLILSSRAAIQFVER
jgi:hypothetical protein